MVLACALGPSLVFLVAYVLFFLTVHLIRRRRKSGKTKPPRNRNIRGRINCRAQPWRVRRPPDGGGAGLDVYRGGADAGSRWDGPISGTSMAARLSGFIIGSEAWLFARIATDNPALSRIVAQSVSDPKAAVADSSASSRTPKLPRSSTTASSPPRYTRATRKRSRPTRAGKLLDHPISSAARESWGFFQRSQTPPPRRSRRRTTSPRVGRKMTRSALTRKCNIPAGQGLSGDAEPRKIQANSMQDERTWKLAGRVMQIVRADQQ